MARPQQYPDYTAINPPIELTELRRIDDLDDLGVDIYTGRRTSR